jgi:hypothetical protein
MHAIIKNRECSKMYKIKCYICNNTYSPEGFTRHVKSCIVKNKNAELQTVPDNDSVYLIKITERYVKGYALYLLIDGCVLLGTLDNYLREIWLECCGHLSTFLIDGQRYDCSPEYPGEYDMNHEIRNLPIDKKFEYMYDFGSTSYLQLELMGIYKYKHTDIGIHLIGRNTFSTPKCSSCDKEADVYAVNPDSIKGQFMCSSCFDKKEKEVDEIYEHPITNSPRMGICGYCTNSSDILYMPSGTVIYDNISPRAKIMERFFSEKFDADFDPDTFIESINASNYLRQNKRKKMYIKHSEITGSNCESLLSQYDKTELAEIARDYNIPSYMSLDSAELFKKVYDHIKNNLEDIFINMPGREILLYKYIIEKNKKNEAITDIDSNFEFDALCKKGILFRYEPDQEPTCKYIIPEDLKSNVDTFINKKEFNKKREFYESVYHVMMGVFFYWGIVTYDDLCNETARILKTSVHNNLKRNIDRCLNDFKEIHLCEKLINNQKYYSCFIEEIEHVVNSDAWKNSTYPKIEDYFIPDDKSGFSSYVLHNPFIVELYASIVSDHKNINAANQSIQLLTEMVLYILNFESETDAEEIIDEFKLYDYDCDLDYINKLIEALLLHLPNHTIKGNALSGEVMTVDSPDAAQLDLWKPLSTVRKAASKWSVGRNDPCPCGSGKKYKKCCLN